MSNYIIESITLVSLIVGIIAGLITIITFSKSVKWKIFFFKFRLRRTLRNYINRIIDKFIKLTTKNLNIYYNFIKLKITGLL